MNDVDWLVGCRFEKTIAREFDWVFDFEHGIFLIAECLWRLVGDGRVVVTSNDHHQSFGRPASVDCVSEVNSHLAGIVVEQVELREGTLDLAIGFGGGLRLELFPDSSGYEAWNMSRLNERLVACGGGRLAIFRDDATEQTVDSLRFPPLTPIPGPVH